MLQAEQAGQFVYIPGSTTGDSAATDATQGTAQGTTEQTVHIVVYLENGHDILTVSKLHSSILLNGEES